MSDKKKKKCKGKSMGGGDICENIDDENRFFEIRLQLSKLDVALVRKNEILNGKHWKK